MHDAHGPFEKMYNAIRALMMPQTDRREAATYALTEFSRAFPKKEAPPRWAVEAVEKVRTLAPVHEAESSLKKGTTAAWVDTASIDQLATLYDALLDLFIDVVQANERQMPSSD